MKSDFNDWPQSRLAETVNAAEILLDVADEDADRVASYLERLPGPLGVRRIKTGASIQAAGGADRVDAHQAPFILVTDKPMAWSGAEVADIKPILVIASDESLSEEALGQLGKAFDLQRLETSPTPLEVRIGVCIEASLYPILIERLKRQEEDQKETEALIKHVGKELSVFYHGFNNPLTVLSGNIQLLQILAETMQVPDDIMKPIQDINGISTRFIHDLATIEELKEMIRDLAL